MLVAIVFGVAGSRVRVPRFAFICAQGIVGCLIARAVTADVLTDVAAEWDWMLFGIAATVVASTLVGWITIRFGTLSGSTAAWGCSPGAASAMVAMAEEFGADARLVALMQYVRVICVVLAASLVSRMLRHDVPAPGPVAAATSAGFDAAGFAATILVAVGGGWIGRRLRIPAGGLLVPLALGAALNATGWVHLTLPPWLLVAAYAAIGWYVGLQFERATIIHSLRSLPQVIAAALAVIVLCGLVAWVMARFGRHDLMTTFLATSPGGIDSVAILALDGGADAAFIMAMQTLRVLVVVATGPAIARFLARTAPAPPPSS